MIITFVKLNILKTMNSNFSDDYNQGNYRTKRSDRYRHPERDSQRYRFDDYGDAAHGGYGNESYGGTFGNQGNEMAGSRNVANRGHHTYSTSRNYGNMGSYGGAQGFGDYRGGRHPQGGDYNFYSGMGSGSVTRPLLWSRIARSGGRAPARPWPRAPRRSSGPGPPRRPPG